ncbi:MULTISPECIES: hypothetical protein [unclassified Corallococcus]|uniref:hypothetical protein n=1 Tax=unclassified Corallococcus TaxID=2685029 RepID=UPI001A8CB5EA|nr:MULTISPECIES: hypothetical protein [unclassified Corallococcus]MBN9686133.1 hypothetical protein [Corallococcus sp. NCSPR001]WAS82432.1 hypothetical protein O0N60_24240 [Corallococcus sp. NCRR]
MKPQISEFSFGYALTEALVREGTSPVLAAPLFPSLLKEGAPGGGYDLMLTHADGLAFLQFKLSDHMVKKSASECGKGHFSPPFFRMHIRPASISNQHAMLCEWAQKGHWVYYAAPAFHTQAEFNDAYLQRKIVDRTFFISPLQIGKLSTSEEHHVAFDTSHNHRVYSKKGRAVSGAFGRRWFTELRSEGLRIPRGEVRSVAERTVNELTEFLQERGRSSDARLVRETLARRNEDPVAQLADLSRTLLDCEVLLVGEGTSEKKGTTQVP